MKILATLLGITFEIHAAEGESLRFDTLPGGIEEGKTYINRDSETSQMQICPILYFSDAVTARPGNQSPPSEKLRETIIPEKIRRSLDKLSADQKTIPIAYFDHHFVPIFQKK